MIYASPPKCWPTAKCSIRPLRKHKIQSIPHWFPPCYPQIPPSLPLFTPTHPQCSPIHQRKSTSASDVSQEQGENAGLFESSLVALVQCDWGISRWHLSTFPDSCINALSRLKSYIKTVSVKILCFHKICNKKLLSNPTIYPCQPVAANVWK